MCTSQLQRASLLFVLAVAATGCQTLATRQQDSKIAQYADDSGFPSPSDVGYDDSERGDNEVAAGGNDTIVR